MNKTRIRDRWLPRREEDRLTKGLKSFSVDVDARFPKTKELPMLLGNVVFDTQMFHGNVGMHPEIDVDGASAGGTGIRTATEEDGQLLHIIFPGFPLKFGVRSDGRWSRGRKRGRRLNIIVVVSVACGGEGGVMNARLIPDRGGRGNGQNGQAGSVADRLMNKCFHIEQCH